MVASLNAFMQIKGADGESKQGSYKGWIELTNWEWEVTAETNWTKGGGASVGKPNPGSLNWEHYWDKSSPTILGYICTGSAFSEVKLEMCKSVGAGIGISGTSLQPYLKVTLHDVFINKVNQSVSEEGGVTQKVEMVFKNIKIDYHQQGGDPAKPGALGPAITYEWDIPGGSASPGAPLV